MNDNHRFILNLSHDFKYKKDNRVAPSFFKKNSFLRTSSLICTTCDLMNMPRLYYFQND